MLTSGFVEAEVAIEPLWYWNEARKEKRVYRYESCNRTIMVLKHSWCREGFAFWQSCNRTIMVLKRGVGKTTVARILASCNRTIMVLKPTGSSAFPISKILVAIEPLWYWNVVNVVVVPLKVIGLQSNHYGIETFTNNIEVWIETRCNRTIMVLKRKTFAGWYLHTMRCNRTIMVLKPSRGCIEAIIGSGLQSNHYGIETLLSSAACSLAEICCNRTIMVLKLFHLLEYWQELEQLQSNHYGIETLPEKFFLYVFEKRCNRTIMVLKHDNYFIHIPAHRVAIEPLWYWNFNPVIQTGFEF